MAGHTPGPWKYCGCGKCGMVHSTATDNQVATAIRGAWGDTWPAIVGESGQQEAVIEMLEYGFVDHAEGIANARLIAAAPDLLEACNLLLFSLHEDRRAGGYLWTGEVGDDLMTDNPIEVLRAAIAKAEGGK